MPTLSPEPEPSSHTTSSKGSREGGTSTKLEVKVSFPACPLKVNNLFHSPPVPYHVRSDLN